MKFNYRIRFLIACVTTLLTVALYCELHGQTSWKGRNTKVDDFTTSKPVESRTVKRPVSTTPTTEVKTNACTVNQSVLQFKKHIRHFVNKYTPNYPTKGYQFLRLLHKKRINQTWSRNEANADSFRKDILAASGCMSARRRLYLTAQNIAVKTQLPFYQNGDPVTMTESFHKLLPEKTIFQSRDRYKRCSVVGSGGVLSGSGCGEEIDKADFTFRFNLAPVTGYENDVGTKTNFTTANQSVLKKGKDPLLKKESTEEFDALQRQFPGSLLWVPAFSQRVRYTLARTIVNISLASGIMKPVVQNPYHFMAMMRLWRALHRRSDWPSTGLYILSAAFELCDKIDVYGFWYFERSLEGVPKPYHYHNDVIYGTRHSRFKEFQDLVNFHEMGILKMHFGSCKS